MLAGNCEAPGMRRRGASRHGCRRPLSPLSPSSPLSGTLNRRPRRLRTWLPGCRHSCRRRWLTLPSESPARVPVRRSQSRAAAPMTNRTMTRADFEALPRTLQRKCFSTLERLRINIDSDHCPAPSLCPRQKPARRRRFGHTGVTDSSDERPSLAPLAAGHLRHQIRDLGPLRPSVMLDATDEAYLRIGKRQQRPPSQARLPHAKSFRTPSAMPTAAAKHANGAARSVDTNESLYECFRWLEEDDTLDLRLFLDDYHFNLREETITPNKSRSQRPSFRRHLSISKLPFGGRVSGNSARPDNKEEAAPASASPTSPASAAPLHARRRSRALSLVSPNKQPLTNVSPVMDSPASHYQDPEARTKLRVYLASPHKFDEAIEFGFPSIDAAQKKENMGHRRAASEESHTLHTFLEDDASSMYSEPSAADPESPRTPQTAEHGRGSHDKGPVIRSDYGQAPACSREMTLRMTLTRPDLRSHEGQMYSWQKGSVDWRSHSRDEPLSPLLLDPKESIERQLAAIDQEELANDNGVVRRFWNKVRRT